MNKPPTHITLMVSTGSEGADLANPALEVLARSLKQSPDELRATLTTGTIEVPKVRVSRNLIDLVRSLRASGLDVKTFPVDRASVNEAVRVQPEKASDPEQPVDSGLDETGTDWEKGDLIEGLYEVLGSADGGMGRVYFVFHRLWKMMLAIKTPLPGALKSQAHLSRFLREGELWVNLGVHPNIAICYYARVINGLPRLFIEYVDGGELDEWIDNKRVQDLRQAIDLMQQFCHGMIHAEQKGMIHRDIKPSNCLMTRDGNIKITDFGLVKRVGGASDRSMEEPNLQLRQIQDPDLTVVEGGVRGSPWWMAPERFTGKAPEDIRADIYSFGVMMYELVLGRMPFDLGDEYTIQSLVKSHLSVTPTDPLSIRPDLPLSLVDIMMTSLAKRPDDRYPSFADACHALEKLSRELSPNSRPREHPNLVALKADTLNNQAVSLLDLGKDDEAMRLLEEAHSANPEHVQTVYNLHSLRWSKGEISDQDLLSLMESLKIEVRETSDFNHLMGLISVQRGDPARGVESLKTACTHGPEYAARWEKHGGDPAIYVNSLGLVPIEEQDRFAGHLKGVRALAFSPSSERIFSVGEDRSIRIWDVATCRCRKNLRTFTFVPVAGAFSSDGKLAATSYGEAFMTTDLWDLDAGRLVRKYQGMAVSGLAFSHDSKLLAGYTGDGALRVWETSSDRVTWDWGLPSGEISCVEFLQGTTSIIIGTRDGSLALVDRDSGTMLWQTRTGEGSVSCLEVSQDRAFILGGLSDGAICLWDVATGDELVKLTGHRGDVVSVHFIPESDFMVSVSDSGTMKIWDLSSARCYRTISVPGENLSGCAVSRDGKRLVSGGARGSVTSWSLDVGWFKQSFLEPAIARPRTFRDLTRLHDSFRAAVQAFNRAWQAMDKREAVRSFEKVRGTPGFCWSREAILIRNLLKDSFKNRTLEYCTFVRSFRGHSDAVVSIAGAPDSLTLLTGSMDGTAALWDVSTGRRIKKMEVGSPVKKVVFVPGRQSVLTWSEDSTVRRWDLEGKLELEIENVECPICFDLQKGGLVALSPDKKALRIDLVTGAKQAIGASIQGTDFQCFASTWETVYSIRDGVKIQRWETKTGYSLGAFRDLGIKITVVKPFGADDKLLAGTETGELIVYMVGSGVNVVSLKGHSAAIRVLAAGLDDHFWITGADDCMLKLWKPMEEECVAVLAGHSAPVRSACFLDNGSMVAGGSSDGTARVWGLEWSPAGIEH